MKKLQYKVLWVALSIVGVMGCQPDLLETIPNDRISKEIFWQTLEDAEFAANAVYPSLDGTSIFSYDGLSDHLLTNHPFNANVELQRGFGTIASGRYFNEWQDAYQTIRRANDFMDNIDQVEESDQEAINRLKGEVMTLRAYQYIKLAMLFGDVPLLTSGIDIEAGRTVTRDPVSEIWDFISSDLSQAAEWLPYQNGSRIGKGAALGLKARAMLYAGRFAEAAAAAKTIIDSQEYALYPDYFELFQYEGENSQEVLLAREFAADVNSHNIYATAAPWSQIPGSTGSLYVPTQAVIDLYPMANGLPISDPESGYDQLNPFENRDPRLYHSVFLSERTPLPDGGTYGSTPGTDGSDAVQITVYSTATGYNIRKYVDEEDYTNPSNSGLNIILLRYAEVLLTYAEAKIELGEIDQSVYDAMNQVRQRESVDLPPITPEIADSASELRELVRTERSVELAFEGFRLFDIRRWELAEQVMPGVPMGRYYEEEGDWVQIRLDGFDRSFDPGRDYLWPIPQRERELNTNLTQNAGY
ncbi:RagB/SusD family nutrient uptake outer membrane protein [Cyclobacterium jeungdonense]|uniref:RagB/SusD family nutrient uptake outer membrane protein n=1 Tax=Cyclobacterium jeungdonense TaxID=708087 RepID=A0ABT8CCQ5_9BACT|nr:RagB/SusD family nutrient uptake outer membrane protein [Cyclobacterium jeungdonense]MDN3689862.1 RagB/SusD family nutrient uptake outer membrane protein [Cyclobacterium jeungdonense]